MKASNSCKSRHLWASLTLFGVCLATLPVQASNRVLTEKSDAQSILRPVQNAKREIKGFIGDENGEPVIGATIRVKGTSVASITAHDWTFAIQAPPNATLEIAYIGYQTRTSAWRGERSFPFPCTLPTIRLMKLWSLDSVSRRKSRWWAPYKPSVLTTWKWHRELYDYLKLGRKDVMRW